MGKIIVCLLLLTAVAMTAQATRPNIVLVMADDQGWGDTAYNGHPVLHTPNLDALAGAGLRFDRFYAAAPVCSPTRGSVMTGRHPNRFGCFSWGHSLRPQEITIAERLREAGYATGHFGKWHLGSVIKGSPVNPGASGFDRWLSAPNFYDNDPILSREGIAVEMNGESSMVAADAAIEFIRDQVKRDKPFFAVVWFGSPHLPHRADEMDRKLYGDRKDAHWLGEISGLDRAVGKLRETLREIDVHENTLFWYTSDNGGLKVASSGGREKKGSVYEGGLRVPAIIEWPERIKKPRVTSVPGNTSDIYPTLLELLAIEPDYQPLLDGVSLASVIDGQSDTRPKPMGFWKRDAPGISTPSKKWMEELLVAQRSGLDYHDPSRLRSEAGVIKGPYSGEAYPGHAAWLDWPWKLHQIDGGKKQPNQITIELYHLENDPMESKNIAEAHPDRVAAMQSELKDWLHSVIDSLNGKDYR